MKSKHIVSLIALVCVVGLANCVHAQPIEEWCFIEFQGPNARVVGVGGSGFEGRWDYYANTNWYNQWFYDHPLDYTKRKVITIDGMITTTSQYPVLVEIAINWSTDLYPPNRDKPPLPPLSPEEEADWIGRKVIFEGEVLPGKTPFGITNYVLPVPYNPEWVSMDVRPVHAEDDGRTEVRAISFKHECVRKLPGPYIDISTLDEWDLLLNRPEGEYPRIDPVPAGVFEEMVQSSEEWPPEYQEAFFAQPELDVREHEDSSGRVEPALYMRWGPEGDRVQPEVFNAAAWDYVYDRPSDLSGVELEFSIHAPRESIRVSVNLIDADGDWLEFIWHVGLPGEIPACQWTIVKIVPSTGYSNYKLLLPAFEGGWSDGKVDLTRITNIRFDENGIWSDEFSFPLDDGWMWNAWNHITVQPVPVDPNIDGLVAYYAFENNVLDSSGNGLHGTIIGDPEFVAGVEGMALDFNGDDYVDCGTNDVLNNLSDAMTVSTWLNIRSVTTTWMVMVNKGETAWRVGVNGDTTAIHYGFTGGDRSWQQANTATELVLGEWYHVAATYDTSVGAQVYLDGIMDASNPDPDGVATNEMPLLLGENPEATGRFFDGVLDEVKIYNRALSAEEISNLAALR